MIKFISAPVLFPTVRSSGVVKGRAEQNFGTSPATEAETSPAGAERSGAAHEALVEGLTGPEKQLVVPEIGASRGAARETAQVVFRLRSPAVRLGAPRSEPESSGTLFTPF